MSDYRPLKFFKDKDGKIVIWQSPNLPLIGWVVFRVLSVVTHDKEISAGMSHLATLLLFTWAYLEAKDGVNTFRRLLGIVVMGLIFHGIFTAA